MLVVALCGGAVASGSHKSAHHCYAGSGVIAADTSQPVSPAFLRKMREVGVDTIIRYFDHENETIPGKTLTFDERMDIAASDFRLLVVFQHWGQKISTFRDRTRGASDAIRAVSLALDVGQPVGSAIYFAVDGPWSSSKDVADIIRYFTDVRRTVAREGNLYRVGVYGSGLVCSTILDRGLADYCWLANAKAWPGYDDHLTSGRWQLRQLMPGKCGDREVDFNLLPSSPAYFGQFR
jgi:hypothetical protein